MILADTSVWIDYFRFRRSFGSFAELLSSGRIVMHPYVLGELACGNLAERTQTITDLSRMRPASVATNPEVLTLIEAHGLYGRGLGYTDVHLLAAARLGPHRLLTRDKRLAAAADQLGVAA
ncbi:MAG: PIN domain-containing protein [Planctomycetota bacterium]